MAHARRYFFEAHAEEESPAAYLLPQKIGELFAIEADISGRPPEERQAVRAARSVPLLEVLKAEFEDKRSRASEKVKLGKALNYALNRWDALTRYTTDGRLNICNNAAERAIRPPPPPGAWPQKLVVRRLRFRRRACGKDVYPD